MELLTILNTTLPNDTLVADVVQLVQRLNNTLHGWNHGEFEPNSQINNMISFSKFNDMSTEINFYNDIAKKNGYESYLDAYNSAVDDINDIEDIESESGVCAVVKIRIEQEIAITREAFLAKLEIKNNENIPIKNMRVDVCINNAGNGENATNLFSVGVGKLSGSLRNSEDDGWILPSMKQGEAEWLIVPYSKAAPTSNVIFDVGGTLMYLLGEEVISIPLLPTKITVMPDPSLHVHYFWEKYVIGDNPFTSEKELSVPFSMGVVVSNFGYGTAFNLRITSAQPKIIENEKGLLIDFKVIGNTVGTKWFTPSLTVSFGNLASNTTVVAHWWMLSSLQGKFTNYSATFENINPLGDPKLSILDELAVHETIKSVYINTPDEDDKILDFLVNDKNDINSHPDTLYSSKNLKSYAVCHGQVLAVDVAYMENGSVSASVATLTNTTGWIYFRYEDKESVLGGGHASGLNTTKQINNETIYLPIENSWRTVNQQNSKDYNKITYLHILDYVEQIGEMTYIVIPCTGDSCPIDVRTFEQPTPVVDVTNSSLTSLTVYVSHTPPPFQLDKLLLENSIWVILYNITMRLFTMEYETRFKTLTANIINDYCLMDICETIHSKRRNTHQRASTVTPDDIIIDKSSFQEEGDTLIFLFYVHINDEVLSQKSLILAVEQSIDEYYRAGFGNIIFSNNITSLSSDMPSTTENDPMSITSHNWIVLTAAFGGLLLLGLFGFFVFIITVLCVRKSRNDPYGIHVADLRKDVIYKNVRPYAVDLTFKN